nr:DUF4260 domain-containing protein [Rhodoferax sp.]
MPFNNPFAAPDFDMQDIRGDHHGVFDPARTILRGEGFAYLVFACALYQSLGFSWSQFVWWFLLPDVAIFVYVFASSRVGMVAYNTTHSSIGAGLVGLVGVLTHDSLYWQIALIWFAHVGFDRALGYGLKYPLGFRVTHLGVLKGMAVEE